jgi:hypothetical protein
MQTSKCALRLVSLAIGDVGVSVINGSSINRAFTAEP